MKISLVLATSAAVALGACSSSNETKHANKDDKAAQAHLMAMHHSVEHMGAWFFAEMDADENGIVTRAEREASVHREWFLDFSKVDLNGDGELTKDEYIKALRINHSTNPAQET